MRGAEAIVCLAWAQELLDRHDATALALATARRACQAASDRLAMAQRSGDPRRISLAHAMLEDALGAHRAGQLAGDRAHRDLEEVLGSLVRMESAYRIAAARRLRGGGSTPVTAPAATPDPSIRQPPSDGAGLQTVRRALRRVGHFLARDAPRPGPP